MDEATFRERFRDSPLKRARRSGLARNAALVLSRRTEPATLAALRRACTDGDPVVATAARWAVEQERGAR
jgi:epoxyqueuosine reductase